VPPHEMVHNGVANTRWGGTRCKQLQLDIISCYRMSYGRCERAMHMRGITVDYAALASPDLPLPYDDRAQRLADILPPLWQKAYRKMAQSPTSIHHFSHRGFDFLFDRASELNSRGILPDERAVEDRIIVAYGRSTAAPARNGNGAKNHLLGDAAAAFGDNTKRPYLPGGVLGGTFDISLYPQYRDLDNEHSPDGRVYRAMKKLCLEHPGTFCFSRPLYSSRSWRPASIEHGLLRADGSFWVHRFRNAPMESKLPLLVRTLTGRAAEAASVD
jgi:hypothetical protein